MFAILLGHQGSPTTGLFGSDGDKRELSELRVFISV